MVPVLSTTAFGRFPSPDELLLLRRLGLLSLQADLDRLPERVPPRVLKAGAGAAGVKIPAAHLPRSAVSLGQARRALDVADELGVRLVVAHLAPDVHAMGDLCDAATERGIILAFEINAGAGASVEALTGALASLGYEHGRHGLCLDTSRWRPAPAVLDGLRPRLRWLEVSSTSGARLHAPPSLADLELRRLVSHLGMAHVCYEVLPAGPRGVIPGEARLLSMLSEVQLWHRGGGRTNYHHLVAP